MVIVEVEGVVISETNYSESSKILNVLTKEYGKIGILSKGCRNIKSKLRGVSSKLTYGKFNIYYKESGLSTLISIDLINSFKEIKSDITKISYASYITELVDQVVKQTDDNVYDDYIACLIKINEGIDPGIITNILELKMLDVLGVKPVIDECVLCGSSKAIVTIDSSVGGYICVNCHTNEKIVSDKTIKLLRMFFYVDISKITKLSVSDVVKKELNEFISDYYDRYTGLYLKSKKFLNTLKKVI